MSEEMKRNTTCFLELKEEKRQKKLFNLIS